MTTRWPRLWTFVATVAACAPGPGPRTGPAAIPLDCPEPPPAMSVTEASAELGRFARETRANLMARIRPLPAGHQALFATLHPPGLSLLEAALASPARAQRLEPAWMQRHLLTAHVELRAQAPLPRLAEGDLEGVELVDGEGRRTRALYLTASSDSGGHAYRLYFDPRFFDAEAERTMVTFRLPLASGGHAEARWRLSQATLVGTDDLPVLYWMTRERGVRLARWSLLVGDTELARDMLAEELRCAPDLKHARQLLRALERLEQSRPHTEARRVSPAALPPGAREELGHDPLQDVALRGALLQRLSRLAHVGLVSPEATTRATEALRAAAKALERGDVGWAVAAALTDLDRAVAVLLGQALDGEVSGKGAKAPAPLALRGLPVVPAAQVTAELQRRVLHANYDLVPRWIKGPPALATRGGKVSRLNLCELRPVLRGEGRGAVATLRQRLGWGWIHPGLPPGRYRTTFADRSAACWRARVGRVSAGGQAAAYRPLARRLLERELHSPDPAVAVLAMNGLVELDGPSAGRDLLRLQDRLSPRHRAALLQAVAVVRDDEVARAVATASRSHEAAVRAGAMQALGRRGLASEARLLRAGLKDPSREVAGAALEGLLRTGDPTGLVEARRWLGADPWRRDRVLALATRPGLKLGGLGGGLLQLARRGSGPPPAGLPAALVAVLGARAARPLDRLYDRTPALRDAVVRSASGPAFEPLLRRVLATEAGDGAGRRHVAALHLAQLKRPPEGLLRRALQDKDSRVRLAAHVGLARLGRADSLLALGEGARSGCWERAAVLPTLCQAMDSSSRGRLLVDALRSGCADLLPLAWELSQRYQPGDLKVLREALGHPRRAVRVRAARAVLGQGNGAKDRLRAAPAP